MGIPYRRYLSKAYSKSLSSTGRARSMFLPVRGARRVAARGGAGRRLRLHHVRRSTMFLRIDKLPVELPQSKKVDPESAAAVQELMGGRFGEMSTFNNYFAQSMNLRAKSKLKVYYELVANIAAEELGHIELVGAAINSLLNGPETGVTEDKDSDPLKTPIHDLTDDVNNYNPHHF